MNRIEIVRNYIDTLILDSHKRFAYSHLYGVSQAIAMIALKRNENVELAIISAMLHDIYTYSTGDSTDHASKGSIMAKEILESLNLFTPEEIQIICGAIFNHSRKLQSNSPFDEILIDADVLSHCLYNPMFEVPSHEVERFNKLKLEFGF